MKKKLVFILILFIIITIILVNIYSSKISKLLLEYANIETKRVAIDIISKSIVKEINKEIDDDIFDVVRDNNGNIEVINYNSKVVNKILLVSSNVVTDNFNKLKDNNYIITRVPIGVISDNILLKNMGPKVPIRLYLDGNILTSLKTRVKEYGYNSALVEISVKIEANIRTLLPFSSDNIKVVNEVPIIIKIVKGNISSIISNE